MRIINVIARIEYTSNCNTASNTKVFFTALCSSFRIIRFIVIRAIETIFIILIYISFISISHTFINIVAVFQRYIVADKFIIGSAAESQFLAAALFIVTSNFIGVDIIVCIFVGNIIQYDAGLGFLVVNPRFYIGKFIVLVIYAAELPAYINAVAGAAEVSVADGNHADKAVSVAVACTDTESTGVHFLNGNFNFHGVRFLARVKFNIYVFKITEVINALHAAAGILGVKRLAFFQLHFTGNNVIFGFYVAFNLKVFNNAFVYQQKQSAVRQHADISNARQYIALLVVFRFKALHFDINVFNINYLVFRQIKDFFNFGSGNFGIAFYFQLFINRVFQYMIGKLHAFRNFGKFRLQIIIPAQTINCVQIFGKAFLS